MRAHEDLRHHFGIEHSAAPADHLDGVQERGHICHPVLQQVTESFVSEAIRSAA